MKKVIRLTESDLTRIVKRIINEVSAEERDDAQMNNPDYFNNPKLYDYYNKPFEKKNKYGSFDDEEWYDEEDRSFDPKGFEDFDFEEEEFGDFGDLEKKHPDTKWFGKGEHGKKMFDKYREVKGKPFKVRRRRD